MAPTKGQAIGTLSQLREELSRVAGVVDVCDGPCANFRLAGALLDRLEREISAIETATKDPLEDDDDKEAGK
jgi:hypothetical protein